MDDFAIFNSFFRLLISSVIIPSITGMQNLAGETELLDEPILNILTKILQVSDVGAFERLSLFEHSFLIENVRDSLARNILRPESVMCAVGLNLSALFAVKLCLHRNVRFLLAAIRRMIFNICDK